MKYLKLFQDSSYFSIKPNFTVGEFEKTLPTIIDMETRTINKLKFLDNERGVEISFGLYYIPIGDEIKKRGCLLKKLFDDGRYCTILINEYQDGWFTCEMYLYKEYSDNIFYNVINQKLMILSDIYKCDQEYGLFKFLKDKGIIK